MATEVKKAKTGYKLPGRRRSLRRALLWVVLLVLIVLLGVLSLALLNLDRLVERNRAFLFAQAEKALGRKLSAETLDTTILDGGRVHMTNITIADDPSFSSDAFFRADEFVVDVALLPLLRKKLCVEQLIVRRPEITVIRDSKARLNVSTLGHRKKPREAVSEEPLDVSFLQIREVEIEEGTLLYRDIASDVEFHIQDLRFEASDLTGDHPITFDLAAAIQAEKRNLTVDGRLGSIGSKPTIDRIPFDVDVKAESLDVAVLQRALTALRIDVSLPPDLRAEGPVSLGLHANKEQKELTLTGSLEATQSAIRCAEQFQKSPGIPLRVRAELRMTPERIALQRGTVELYNLQIEGSGELRRGDTGGWRLAVRSDETNLLGWENIFPPLNRYDLAGRAKLNAEIQCPKKGEDFPTINGALSFDGAAATLPGFPKRVTDLSGELALNNEQVDLRHTTLRIGDSQLSFSGRADRLTRNAFEYFLREKKVGIDDFVPLSARAWFRGLDSKPVGEKVPFDVTVAVDSAEVAALQGTLRTMGVQIPPHLQAEGALSLELHAKNAERELTLTGSIEATECAIRYTEQFQKSAGTPLRVRTDLRMTPERIVVQSGAVELHHLRLDGSGDLRRGDDRGLQLALRSGDTNLTRWEEIFPALEGYELAGRMQLDGQIQIPTRGEKIPNVSGALSFDSAAATVPGFPKRVTDATGQLIMNGQRAELRDTTLRVGNSQVRLSADLEQLTPLALDYSLRADELRLDNYISPPPEEWKQNFMTQVESRGHVEQEEDAFSFNAFVTSSSGMFFGSEYTDLQAHGTLQKQAMSIQSLSFHAFDGTVLATGTYNFREKDRPIEMHYDLRHVNIEALSRAIDPQTKNPLQGRLNLECKVSGKGQTWDAIRPTILGKAKAEVVEGRLPGINIVQAVLSPLKKIPGLATLFTPIIKNKYTDLLTGPDTRFAKLESSAVIRNEEVQIERLQMDAENWSIRGDASVGFDQTVDGKAVLVLSPRLLNGIVRGVKKSEATEEKKGMAKIPFALKGTLSSMKVVPDAKSMAMAFPSLLGKKAGELGELSKSLIERVVPLRPFKKK